MHVRLVGARLHRKPCDGSIRGRSLTRFFDNSPHILARILTQIGHDHGVKDYRRDVRVRLGEMSLKPWDSVRAIDLCGNASRDFDHYAKLLESFTLIRPDETEDGGTALIERRIDRIQIAAAALNDPNCGWHIE